MQCTLKADITLPFIFKQELSKGETICSECSVLLHISQQVQVSSGSLALHLKSQICILLSGRGKLLMGTLRASNTRVTYYLRDATCNIMRDVWICCKQPYFLLQNIAFAIFLPTVLYCLNISNYFRQINFDIFLTLLSCFFYSLLKI